MVMVFLIIEALYEAMVIDLFTSRPSVRQWSLISYVISRPCTRQWSSISLHQDPLRGNGHWFSYVTSRPSTKQWSWFFSSSRPSVRQCSSISLHQDPLRGNGHWFLMSHRGHLRGNGHRSLYIKTLYETMVIDFLCHIEALYMVMVTESYE